MDRIGTHYNCCYRSRRRTVDTPFEKLWYCTCEMKNLGTPETHPKELVVFKKERKYYKICLLSDNPTTRSSSGWVLAIPKIYIMKNYDVETFKRRFGSSFMIPVYVKRYQVRIHLIISNLMKWPDAWKSGIIHFHIVNISFDLECIKGRPIQ